MGRLLENIVFLHLRRKTKNIFYSGLAISAWNGIIVILNKSYECTAKSDFYRGIENESYW